MSGFPATKYSWLLTVALMVIFAGAVVVGGDWQTCIPPHLIW